jgi:hypothetical protein
VIPVFAVFAAVFEAVFGVQQAQDAAAQFQAAVAAAGTGQAPFQGFAPQGGE